jgi:hypothetical protein
MIWDIVIAVAAAFCQLVTALLGWRITMNPLNPNDPKQRKKRMLYHAMFVSAGLFGVAFIGLAAYRTPRERAHFMFETGATYLGQSSAPSWASGTGERRAEFMMIDKPLAFNVWHENIGPGVASEVKIYKATFVEPEISPISENDSLAQFEKMKAVEPPKSLGTVIKGQRGYATASGPVLSPEDYNNLVYGRRVVYVIAELSYTSQAAR